MNRIAKFTIALGLAAAAAACGPTIVAAPDGTLVNTGVVQDGDCLTRTVMVYDRELGYERAMEQRFCGGRARIAR
ncbi:hypothetical protein QO058_27800 [Bosea vestrisii]|uniref:hypothetical protein n=1 Tax=Bosea vestrisii TaxID=151416 RepID=UPI0024E03912|nr:hypothetical protein [Bosea vestrisii]WID96477.1 hypothetical protein QO058_27800 [Bosea vestrisii]